MKPLKLTMSAFGPYANEETIDFRELNDNSLFLISGNTGTGKTTIFDAISYSLFGEASGTERKSKQMRSDFAKEQITFVEFIFSLYGKKYRVKRTPTQLRAKKNNSGLTKENSSGEFQEIGKTNIIISIKNINTKIEELLGLNVDQFRQIMMIPQGDFKRLILSRSDEREKILKTLFKTHRYRELQDELKSMSNSLQRDFKESQTKREHKLENIQFKPVSKLEELLSPDNKIIGDILMETRNLITKDNEEKDNIIQKNDKLKTEQNQLISEEEKAKTINQCFRELEQTFITLEKLNSEKDRMGFLEQKVKAAIKTDAIIPVEDNINKLEKKIEKNEQLKKRLEQDKENSRENLNGAIKNKDLEESPARKKIREDSRKEIDKLKRFSTKVNSYLKSQDKLKQKEKEVNSLETEIENNKKELAETTRKINHLEKDEKVLNKLTVEKGELSLSLERQKTIKEKLKTVKTKLEKNDQQTSQKEKSEEELNKLEAKIKKAIIKKEAIEKAEKQNIVASLAENLQEDDPCPVCGSSHHPQIATHTKEIPNSSEKIELKSDIDDSNDLITRLKSEIMLTISLIKENKNELQAIIKELNKSDQFNLIADDKLAPTIQSYLDNITIFKIEKDLSTIEARLKSNDVISEQLEKAKLQIDKLVETEQALTESQREIETIITQEATKIKEIEKELTTEQLEINDFAGLINEEQDKLKELDKALETATELVKQWEIKTVRTDSELNSCSTNIKNDIIDLNTQKSDFQTLLQKADFKNADDYVAHKMDEDERNNASRTVNDFNKRLIETENNALVLKEKTTGKKEIDISVFADKIKKIAEKIEVKNSETNNLENRINNNKKAIAEIEIINKAIASKEREFATIGTLAKAANGDNSLNLTFESYILTAFLDDILKAANSRLQIMSDSRYYLQREMELIDGRSSSGLNLNVLDQHTGQVRSVTTLSGGEIFKASLSMALGLADIVQMFSGGITIDVMFIDEGFGSLDTDSLEQALNCLLELKSTGRMVGIISHVPSLKERIPTRLEIISSPLGSKIKMHNE